MKRWQTRGEVQDSDEEEISLDASTRGLEHPPKRIKILKEVEDNDEQDEEGPQVTPGASAPLDNQDGSNAERHHDTPETTGVASPSPGHAPADVIAPDGTTVQDDDKEPDWTTRTHAHTYGRLQRISRSHVGKTREMVPVVTQAEQNAVDATTLQTTYDLPSSSILPEDPIAPPEEHAVSPQPMEGYESLSADLQAGDSFSRASSPLSELSNPPDSPPEFLRLPDSSLAQPQTIQRRMSTASPNIDIIGLDDHILPPALLTQGARRSLRARQEKQLHPYMFDKAQYQQQCRERGIRPVRLVEQTTHEIQDGSLNQDNAEVTSSATRPSSSSSSLSGLLPSGPPFEESVRTDPNQAHEYRDEDDLPDINDLLQSRPVPGRLHSRKRQKLLHRADRGVQDLQHGTQEDVFTVPPSPPPSSKDSAPRTAKAPRGFRLPRGLSPMPLPTPQISSVSRPFNGNGTADLSSEEDAPPRTARRLARVRSAVTIASDSSTESEVASEDDQRLLSRERKRIRGVLPASWLNIDRKTHPKPHIASIDRVERDSPEAQPAPQRGVARKLNRRSTAALGFNVLEILDGDELSGSDVSTPTTTQRKAPDLPSQSHPARARNKDQDDDDMELDWFDPMLAGATRAPRAPGSKTKQRARNSRSSTRRSRLDFSEERNGLRQAKGISVPKRTIAVGKTKKQSSYRKKAPVLGILDAPRTQEELGTGQPQFVRLAARQARRAPDRGRHSPSNKTIRLATREDTQQANATLEDWRRGTIALRNPDDASQGPRGDDYAKQPRSVTQLDPRTPRITASKQPLHSRTLSVSSGLTFPQAPPESTSSRSTPHSASSRQALARQHPPQRVGTAPGLRAGKHKVPKIFAQPMVRYRGAQLETQETASMQQSRSTAFQRRMQCLTETVTRRPNTPVADTLPMTRFLQEPALFPQKQQDPPPTQPQEHRPFQPQSIPRQPRKRRTQRFDIDTRQFRQPSEPLPDENLSHVLEDTIVSESRPILQGLGPSGTRYATDFDIRRLPTSTFFHESTFIGSGDLVTALAMADRIMEQGSGSLRIYIRGSMHEWTAWSEQVSAALADIPPAISEALNAVDSAPSSQHDDQISAVALNIEHMLRSTIRYLANCLYFLDAVDRGACCEVLGQLVQDLMELIDQTELWSPGLESLRRRTLQHVLVIARQTQVLGNNTIVPATVRADLRDRTVRISSRLAACLVPRLSDLRSEYEQQRTLSVQEQGIRQDDSILAGMVVLHQCMRSDFSPTSLFWEVVGKALNVDISNVQSTLEIDAVWYSIFTILPCLDFSAAGIVWGRTDESLKNEWRLPGQLVERCLELYPATSLVRGSSINEYVRATLTRCLCLFTRWRWWGCESVLSTVYDFFARRNLGLLHHEDGHGSPEFLESLTCFEDTSLEVGANDRSFSIFLKLLVASLQTWKQLGIYTDKKIGGIAWRIIPNHARIYRKDAEVQRSDLNALRNHFDLLCTLYFASPPLLRLRVDMLRNLVDHSTSHREACRISVRAWSRLASFQMSTNEPADKLEPFVDWFKDMLQTTVAQYFLARSEAERQYADAKASGAIALDNDILEKTIASNQRQIAATIVDLLAAFRRALNSASCAEAASLLITGCEPWKAVDSFHSSQRRLAPVYNEVLDVFKATIDVQQRLHMTPGSHTQSEDSQDYGDIDIFQELATGEVPNVDSKENNLVALMHDAFAKLVSDAFGLDTAPDDSLLARVLDTWIPFAKYMVSNGLRSWGNFLIDYNTGAWNQLLDTPQRRKFTPYALAAILEADPNVLDTFRTTFLTSWFESLMERASTLKYQHLLTESLLNVSQSISEPILRNLPFSKTSRSPLYHVTLQELRQRRLALISSVLSNMSEHYNEIMLIQPRSLPGLGRFYAELVRKLMHAMKNNYSKVQQVQGDNTAEVNVRGDYVIFVQEVVAFLQQYTIEGVYTVDRFFLDSSAFPLPADDPTYVVGRLRKHMPKLAEAKTRKQLATFLHNISERAAFDQQQAYLSDQLHKAMSGTTELGEENAPSLRHVLLTSIIPAYIEKAIAGDFTWILAMPMIDASGRTVADLLYDTDLNSERSVTAATEQIAALLGGVQKALTQLALEALRVPRVLESTRTMFKLCEASVVFVNYVQRSTGQAASVLRQLQALQQKANRIEECLTAPKDFFDLNMDDMEGSSTTCQWPDTSAFTAEQVRESEEKTWSLVNERYYVKRGNGSREVVVQVGGYDEGRDGVLEAIADFRRICERQNRRGVKARRGRGGTLGLEDLVI